MLDGSFRVNNEECPPERHVRTLVEVAWLEGARGFWFKGFERGYGESFP